jgi:hypothetical protein
MDLTRAFDAKQMSRDALEDYAREVFDIHNVAYRVFRAIRAGRDCLYVTQEKPVDLSGTDAAYRLVVQLEKLGYATSWEEARRTEIVPRNETAREIVYCELVIEWFDRLFAAT